MSNPVKTDTAMRGYDLPLYILPFDHRASYIAGMFGWHGPLDAAQRARVVASKQLIYAGFKQAVAAGVAREHAGILVDEEFGAELLRDAAQSDVVTALPTERSGGDEFQFEYGADFADHIDRFNPTFAKVLVRYNPDAAADINQRQRARLQQLSAHCERSGRRFMFELLVPATPAQLQQVRGDKAAYDREIRPQLVERIIQTLQESGIEPDVWKIEGLDAREDCQRIVDVARRDGRDRVSCIVLGRGADDKKVEEWLKTAASVPGFTGFAVGRTSFWDAVADWEAGRIESTEAVTRIAGRYREWVDIFEAARTENIA